MSKPSLAGVDLKLWRADDHLEFCFFQRASVSAGVHTGGESAVVGEFEPDTGDYVLRVMTQAPDPMTGIILGEFAHNLRSALDHLVYQLILLNGGDPEIGKPAFPILEKTPDPKNPNPTGLRGRIAKDHLTRIERAQPYHLRKHPHLAGYESAVRSKQADAFARWHPLALLGFLNNTDKHKRLHAGFSATAFRAKHPTVGDQVTLFSGFPFGLWYPVGTALPVTGASMPVSPDGSVIKWDGHSFAGSDDDPTEIARIFRVVIKEGTEPKMKMHPYRFLDVAFGNRERRLSYINLLEIRDGVREIVAQFAPFFPGPPPRTRSIPTSA